MATSQARPRPASLPPTNPHPAFTRRIPRTNHLQSAQEMLMVGAAGLAQPAAPVLLLQGQQGGTARRSHISANGGAQAQQHCARTLPPLKIL